MRRPYPFVLSIAVTIVCSREHAAAAASTAERPATTAAWMPDVGNRLASLRERLRRADEEARDRQEADLRGGQWWRAVVIAAPRAETRR